MNLSDLARLLAAMERLERRRVVTTDPAAAEECCGLHRDADGFCSYRPGHPIYIGPSPLPGDSLS